MDLDKLLKRMRELGGNVASSFTQPKRTSTLNRASQNTQRVKQSIGNFRASPNTPTVSQAFQSSVRNNPLSTMARGQYFGDSRIDQKIAPVTRPIGQFGGGVISGLSLGFVNPVANAQPTNRFEQGANIAGNIMGMFNPVSAGNQILGRVGTAGTRLGTSLALRSGVPSAGKAIGALAGEVAQTGTLMSASALSGRDFNPVTDLAFGLGTRGALGTLYKGLSRGVPKGYSPRINRIIPMDGYDTREALEIINSKTTSRAEKQDAWVTLQNIAEAYMPGIKNSTNAQVKKAAEDFLTRFQRQQDNFDIPKMGIKGDDSPLSQGTLRSSALTDSPRSGKSQVSGSGMTQADNTMNVAQERLTDIPTFGSIDEQILKKYPQADPMIEELDRVIQVHRINLPKDQQGKGTGTKIINEILEYADRTGKRVELTTDTGFGSDKARLTDFYKRFGFSENPSLKNAQPWERQQTHELVREPRNVAQQQIGDIAGDLDDISGAMGFAGRSDSTLNDLREWERQIKRETITQRQNNQAKQRSFNQTMRVADEKLTKAYKGGKIKETTQGFPSKALSSKDVRDKGAFAYQRETLLRNIEDTFKGQSQQVKQYFHDPIVANETAATNFRNDLRTRLSETFKSLGITRGSKEDYAAADYIEGTISADELMKRFPGKAQEIMQAAEEGRAVYKNLLNQVNATLTKFGYDPIPERQNYVTHTRQIQTLSEQIGSLFNLSKDKLPQAMAGINLDTQPGRQFFKFGQQRQGGSTHEGLIGALDKYIDPVANQIYHTEDIQRGRALLKYLQDSADPSDTRLSNFTSYLRQYVDHLSGKQNIIDRPFEKVFGRNMLAIGNKLRQRTGANMVGGSFSSAITNFIPFTNSLATTSKPAVAKGLYEAALSPATGSTMIDGVQSGFLTRRFPKERIGSTVYTNMQGAAGALFKWVDQFTSKAIVAGKYHEGIAKGLDPQTAMAQADEYAARALSDRSFAQSPLLFNSKVLGAVTQFQNEVNNQVSFLFKDIPNNLGYNKAQVASALAQFAVYSYVFNEMYERVTGRRPQLDPMNAGLTLYSQLQEGAGIGEILDPTDQYSAVGGLAQSLPFSSVATGGRIPIGGAIPDVVGLAKGETTLGKEAVKPLAYLLPPFGGGQIKKTLEGTDAYNQGFSETATGNIRFPIEQNFGNLARSVLFGQYSTPEARQYFESDGRPLSENQSMYVRNAQDKGNAFARIVANREESKTLAERKAEIEEVGGVSAGDNEIIYMTDDGTVATIDLSKYDKKATGLKKFELEDEKIETARKIYAIEDESITDEQKAAYYKRLGFKAEDVEYDYLANQENDIKSAYFTSEFGELEHDQLIETLTTLRKPSVSGKIPAADGVLDDLYEDGLISDAERKMLKKIDYDKNGKLKSGSGGKKFSVAAPKAIGTVSVKQSDPVKITMNIPKMQGLKLAPMPEISAPPLTRAQNVSTISVGNSRPEPIRVRKTQVRFGR